MTRFGGVWPALITPAVGDGSVHETCLRALIEHLIERRVDGLYIGGSTGEGLSQPVAERRRLTEITMHAVAGQVPVIVHVGRDRAAGCRRARPPRCAHRVAGISSILPPGYDSEESLWRYYECIAAAAPSLPLLAYILNDSRGTLRLMQRLQQLPQLAGAKYTGPDMYEFGRMVQLGDGRDWSMFTGMDEMCIHGVLAGAAGNIGSTLNFMPGVYREIRSMVLAGDVISARSLQQRANHITTILHRHGYMARRSSP